MRNPFKAPLPVSTAYSPQPSDVGMTDDVTVHNVAVELGDGYAPDTPIPPARGNIDVLNQEWWPGYAGKEAHYQIFQPVMQHTQEFVNPDVTVGSIPGTDTLVYADGPVTGNAMDAFQTGNRQQLASTPPGSYGPVVGGPDYANVAALANYQEALSTYSTAVSDQAMIAAI